MGIKCGLLFVIAIMICVTFSSHSLLAAEGQERVDEVIMHEMTDNTAHPFWSYPIKIGSLEYTFKLTKHFILLMLVSVLCLSSMLYLAHKLKTPFKKPTLLQNMLEVIVEYLDKHVIGVTLGEKGHAYLPFCLTMFFFILFANFVGLIPAWLKFNTDDGGHAFVMGAITSNLAVTGALAVLSFCAYNIAGMRSKGVIKYWLGLVPHGVPIVLAPLIWLIEFVGLFTRAFSLAIRLFANMTGGHIMIIVIPFLILIFGGILPNPYIVIGGIAPLAIGFLLFIFTLELFVSVVQAYVFSFLTAVFISLALEDH